MTRKELIELRKMTIDEAKKYASGWWDMNMWDSYLYNGEITRYDLYWPEPLYKIIPKYNEAYEKSLDEHNQSNIGSMADWLDGTPTEEDFKNVGLEFHN